MLKYISDAILLVIICCIPLLVGRTRLRSPRDKEQMYERARSTTGISEDSDYQARAGFHR
jgi:hypothetical protein